MPEIKNQFTGGKMNKDVDLRLVPKGEYRDAMNIQVSTSEQSDVGTIQNILGNSKIQWMYDGQEVSLPNSAYCVGSISDEKNDALYWFVSGGTAIDNYDVTISKDLILELKNGIISPVFVDLHSVTIGVYSLAAPSSGNIILHSMEAINALSVGDVLTNWMETGASYNDTMTIQSIDPSTLTINIGDYTNASFATSQGQDISFQVEKQRVLNFDSSRLITGINIIDDMLFWTDNYSEPKKINISRSKQGTNPNGEDHTVLVNNYQNITVGDNIKVEEKHITVIKRAPKSVLSVKTQTIPDFAFGTTLSTVTWLQDPNNPIQGNLIPNDTVSVVLIFDPTSNIPLDLDDTILFNPITNTSLPNTEHEIEGYLTNLEDDGSTDLIIGGTTLASAGEYQIWEITIVKIANYTSVNPQEYNWAVEFTADDKFKNKFPRFSYRYKYQDGEYSAFAPFTHVVFETGDFKYEPKEAYNLGMENQVTSIKLTGWRSNMPEDVEAIDLLYKESNSPTIYTIDTLYNVHLNSNSAKYQVKPNQIRAVLPENQLLRPWDNVPRKALAQEITGSRIVYGNYLQNYNISSPPSLKASIEDRNQCSILTDQFLANGVRSLKSIRNYSLGISYLDKYGRQTPVFTNKQADFEVPIKYSASTTQILAQPIGYIPSWATHYKYFVKETSNEYYNLAMDRIYDAKDGNIWLSFPSSDRNKVDEETYLILKKGVEGGPAINEPNRYKILAIENEAPEYVRTESFFIAEIQEDVVAGGTFLYFTNISGYPIENSSTIIIDQAAWDATNIPLVDIDRMAVRFSRLVGGQQQITDIYDVSAFGLSVSAVGAPTTYQLTLKKPIEEAWLNDPNAPNQPDPTVGMVLYKKIIENRAEFDGRFFVKVARDIMVDTYIIQQATISLTVTPQPSTVLPFYYLADSGNAVYVSNPTTTSITTASGGTVGTRSDTKEDWEALLDPEGTGMQGMWFIDAARFSGSYSDDMRLQHTGMYDPVSDGQQTAWTGNAHIVRYADLFNRINPTTGLQLMPIPEEIDGGWNKGIWTDPVNGQTYMYLSYGYIRAADGPGANSTHGYSMHTSSADTIRVQDIIDEMAANSRPLRSETAWQQLGELPGVDPGYTGVLPEINDKIKHWKLGSSLNVYHNTPELQDIVQIRLKTNSKFSFGGDPDNTVYTITGAPEIKYHVNFDNVTYQDGSYPDFVNEGVVKIIWDMLNLGCNALPSDIAFSGGFCDGVWNTGWLGGSGPNYWVSKMFDAMNRLGLPQNKRVTWKIPIDKDPTAADSTFNPLDPVLGANATDIGTIQFIEEVWASIDNQIVAENPAIWETEPKQDVDLDIYYEIDSTFPIYINNDTNYTFAPIGSAVSTGLASPPIKVLSWSDNVVTIDLPISDTALGVANFIASYPTLTFHRPDGSCVQAEMINWLNTSFDAGTNETTTVDIEVSRNVVYNPDRLSWYNCYSFENGVESDRIRDDYNQVRVDKGAKASSTLEETEPYTQEHRKYGLIYSGLYNSMSNFNNLNQFITAEKITKDINPIYGSIQKLYSRSTADGDLITLCEDRILKILANKDAVFNADGNMNLTATENVLGQAIPYAGEYGISKNPESFASEAYRAYFADKTRGNIMRLSMDGLTPISDHGMKDWFRDNLKLNDTLIGSYDDKKDEYNITLQHTNDNVEYLSKSVTFREDVRGWVSFKSFVPENAISCANEYYTFKDGAIWQHHIEVGSNTTNTGGGLNNRFYNIRKPSSFKVILNEMPGSIKSFTTLNYEGSHSKVVQAIDPITGGALEDNEYYNLTGKNGWYVRDIKTEQDEGSINEFIQKESKWFNYIRGKELEVSYFCGTSWHCLKGGFNSTNYQSGLWQNDNFAHQGLGMLNKSPVNITVYGCTDPSMFNYDPAATVLGISALDNEYTLPNTFTDPCEPYQYGCMDPAADNYFAGANTDDGSCIYSGCTDNTYPNGCGVGCNGAINYDPNANVDDGSCIYCVLGCTDNTAFNFNPNATCDDGSCVPYIYGCTDNFNTNVLNYDPAANTDDGSCNYSGCTDPTAINAFFVVPTDGVVALGGPNPVYNGQYLGCYSNTPPENYFPFQTTLQSPFPGPTVDYLTDVNSYLTSNSLPTITYIPACPTVDNGSCIYAGCTDDTAINYDPNATVQSLDSCVYCGDEDAYNYDGAPWPSSTDNCEYCENLLPTVLLDNATTTSFDITWTHPTSGISPNLPGSNLNTGDNGLYQVRIEWGITTNIPPYNGSNHGGYFQYSPTLLANGTYTLADYPAITDNGDGTFTITVEAALPTASPIFSNTTYSVAIDTFCINNIGGFDDQGNAIPILDTYYITSNANTGVQITTLPAPGPNVYGCLADPNAINYMCPSSLTAGNPNSPVPCIGVANGGIDPNGGQIVNADDGTCISPIPGCIDHGSCSPGTNCWDGVTNSPTWFEMTSPLPGVAADNYNGNANTNDGSCQYTGCMDPAYCNYNAAYNVACLDDNNDPNGTVGGSCCDSCGDPLGLNYSGITNPNCTANCQYCSILPAANQGSAADGLGLTPTYSGGPVLASDGNYYMPLDVTFSFPNSFDFNTVRCESNNWLAIRLKVRDVTGWDGVSFPPPNFETYYMQIDCNINPPLGQSITRSFGAWDTTGLNFFSPKILVSNNYEYGFHVVCDRLDGQAIGATDYVWIPLGSYW